MSRRTLLRRLVLYFTADKISGQYTVTGIEKK